MRVEGQLFRTWNSRNLLFELCLVSTTNRLVCFSCFVQIFGFDSLESIALFDFIIFCYYLVTLFLHIFYFIFNSISQVFIQFKRIIYFYTLFSNNLNVLSSILFNNPPTSIIIPHASSVNEWRENCWKFFFLICNWYSNVCVCSCCVVKNIYLRIRRFGIHSFSWSVRFLWRNEGNVINLCVSFETL